MLSALYNIFNNPNFPIQFPLITTGILWTAMGPVNVTLCNGYSSGGASSDLCSLSTEITTTVFTILGICILTARCGVAIHNRYYRDPHEEIPLMYKWDINPVA